jgi:hypothetical protein
VSARPPGYARWPGEAFGLAPGAGLGVRRAQPVDVQRIAILRSWALRLRLAATALWHLAAVVLAECDDAGLDGPAGDALQALGADVAQEAAAAAKQAEAAADELDLVAAVLMATPHDLAEGQTGPEVASTGRGGRR